MPVMVPAMPGRWLANRSVAAVRKTFRTSPKGRLNSFGTLDWLSAFAGALSAAKTLRFPAPTGFADLTDIRDEAFPSDPGLTACGISDGRVASALSMLCDNVFCITRVAPRILKARVALVARRMAAANFLFISDVLAEAWYLANTVAECGLDIVAGLQCPQNCE